MKKNEKGFTLIEIIIALGVLGIISIAIFGAISGASRVLYMANERTTAESIARTQMEDIKYQAYKTSYDPTISTPTGYTIEPINTANGNVVELQVGLQKITIRVSHNGKLIKTSGNFTLEGYKLNR